MCAMRARSTGRLRYWQQLLRIAGTTLWLGAGACSTDSAAGVSLAQPCSSASDCRAPLICVFQLCHNACKEDRDCEGEARCVLGKDGNVCQLEKEIACSQGADCPGSQVCAADGECRDTCKRASDCTTSHVGSFLRRSDRGLANGKALRLRAFASSSTVGCPRASGKRE